jgi:DNA-binding CsgD family transcriptional regulator
LRAGGSLIKSDYAEHYATGNPEPAASVRPFLMGLTREDPESALPGTTCSFLFERSVPRFGFSPAEQRMLLWALLVQSDSMIAERLGLSPSTLKQTWRSIYDRVSCVDPLLDASDGSPMSGTTAVTARGKEKRTRLIEYLRLHMEELRPFPRAQLAASRSVTRSG